MTVALTCEQDGCSVTVREMTERRALHRMMIHGQQADHDTGHLDDIQEEFDAVNNDDDDDESDDEHHRAKYRARPKDDDRSPNFGHFP